MSRADDVEPCEPLCLGHPRGSKEGGLGPALLVPATTKTADSFSESMIGVL